MKDLQAIRFVKGTKISHDYSDNVVSTFSYRDLCQRGVECIGIPAKQNGLIIVDVDVEGPSHQHDGREWWSLFSKENSIPETYTVRSPSGGFHYYFKLPDSINPESFSPPSQLAKGVDLKYNGWVGAPPSQGYSVYALDVARIQVAPPSLMMHIHQVKNHAPVKEFDSSSVTSLELHKPFSAEQIKFIKEKMQYICPNLALSYSEWRDGLFSLKAGVEDPETLDDLTLLWTFNKSYQVGDEFKAKDIVDRASRQGNVGPGTILAILKAHDTTIVKDGEAFPFSPQEILDRSKIPIGWGKDGSIRIEPSETNASKIICAIFSKEELYTDVRSGHYVFKGKSCSDTEIVNQIIPIIQGFDGLSLEKFRKQTIVAGLEIAMTSRTVDPHKEFLSKAIWDGVPRIEEFFVKYCGVEDSEYIRIVGKNLWTALAARGLEAGCKFDSMVVIEGHEGIRKSSLVEVIGGEYTYAPFQAKAFQNLDDLRQMHQAVVVELPELIGVIGQESEQVKNVLSKRFDDIRGLFAKRSVKNLRSFVFIGTTNSTKYLEYDMGERRFWPVKIPRSARHIDLNSIKMNRAQLFAEGVHYFREGYEFYKMPHHLLEQVVAPKYQEDPLREPLANALDFFGSEWTTSDAFQYLVGTGFLSKNYTQQIYYRIEKAFFSLGCYQDFDPVKKRNKWKRKFDNPLDAFI